MTLKLRIIRPASREQGDLLSDRIAELRAAGHTVLYEDLPRDATWAYAAALPRERAQALMQALTEPGTDAVLCARGGYGASDLLPLLDWDLLRATAPRPLVGFSDISALHCAFYALLGWPGLHAPMPATVLWRQNGVGDDVEALLANLKQLKSGGETSGSLPVTPVGGKTGPHLEGRLFGGCFTVLSALIGTSYFPKSLAGHWVFLEDTDEHPGRLMRMVNQWLQAGALTGVRGLVVGSLRRLGENIPDSAPFVLEQLASRTGLPVYHTPLFGHTSPNFPLLLGANAVIDGQRLSWRYRGTDHANNKGSLT